MIVAIVIVCFYCLSLLLIFIFSVGQLHLTWHYLNAKKVTEPKVTKDKSLLPVVTVQLPVYNEKYVIKRLLESITKLDYPIGKLHIQVLDDSTDETIDIIASEVKRYQNEGIDIEHIKREKRTGFKAGALANGLKTVRSEFIAIFDADFIPGQDFLLKTIPHFKDPNIGVVQTRWGHVNRDYSLLTKLQSFGLDAHFSVEQTGRSAAGSFINFNGTGGVWRKKCISTSGGWSDDTLTEDLDLSYRAQLKGWKFKFIEECETPAELPVIMTAIKSQQYRWNKGAAETAVKHIKSVFSSTLPFVNKVHGLFHLFNSSIFIFVLLGALLSIPMLYIKDFYPQFNFLFHLGGVFILGFLSITFFYWVSAKRMFHENTFSYFVRLFPAFLTVSMGLSLHNAIAVIEGLIGKKTPFIRTPKFNIVKSSDSWKQNQYIDLKLNGITIIEGMLCLYFVGGLILGVHLNDYGLLIFHFMLAVGFGLVFIYSMKALRNA